MTGRDRMTERVRSFMEKWNMTEPGDTVILGLSGGADSAALFAVLLELKDAMGFALRAVHVHHGLRGSEADRDLKFSRELCKRAGVPFLAFPTQNSSTPRRRFPCRSPPSRLRV